MLTEKVAETPATKPRHAPAAGALDELICYFEGAWVPMRDAKVSIMTHAFMYGTATFEGIRAYWNEEQGTLYGLKIREHVERIRQSCRILLMQNVPSVDELTGLIMAVGYVRPSKDLRDVEVSSVKKKWKDKRFAAGVDRGIIERGAAMLGMDLPALITETILGMRTVAEEIGLKGTPAS